MKRWFFLILILIFPALCFSGGSFQSHLLGVMKSRDGGGAATEISDDFTGADLSAWYDPEGAASCSGTTCNGFELLTGTDQLDNSASTGLIVYDTALDDANQIICVKWSEAGKYTGVALRQSKSCAGSYNNYAVRFDEGTDTGAGQYPVVRYCDCSSCTDVPVDTDPVSLSDDIDDDDWVCFGANGTGSSTEFKLWDYGAVTPDPGTTPAWSDQATVEWCDAGSCGASDVDVNIDMTDVNTWKVDSGNYVGAYSGSSSSHWGIWAEMIAE